MNEDRRNVRWSVLLGQAVTLAASALILTLVPPMSGANLSAQSAGSAQALNPIRLRSASKWVSAWQASPTVGSRISVPSCPYVSGLSNQTVRNIAFLSAGGDQLRVRVSNFGGSAPLLVGAASVAQVGEFTGAVVGSPQSLRFAGNTSVLIGAESEAVSDPISFPASALSTVAISIYVPEQTGPATQHFFAAQENSIAAGNQVMDRTGAPFSSAGTCWMLLSGIDVFAAPNVIGTLITLGDSITDGGQSTAGANLRYPDQLAQRFAALSGSTLSVSNAGLGGNDLLDNRLAEYGVPAQARLARDVLTQPNVRAVILLEGINDIGANSALASELIQVDKQIIAQVHAAGLKIYGGTLTPFGGSQGVYGGNFGTAAGEIQRKALNQWILTSGAFDGVIDFDKALRDPQNPSQMLPVFDSGDHLHPGDAGYKAMADAVDIDSILLQLL